MSCFLLIKAFEKATPKSASKPFCKIFAKLAGSIQFNDGIDSDSLVATRGRQIGFGTFPKKSLNRPQLFCCRKGAAAKINLIIILVLLNKAYPHHEINQKSSNTSLHRSYLTHPILT